MIDLVHVFRLEPVQQAMTAQGDTGRLPPEVYRRLCASTGEVKVQLCGDASTQARLRELRLLYEPSAMALANYLEMSLPSWIAEPGKSDQWQKISALRSQPDLLASAEHIRRETASMFVHDGVRR